MIEVRLTGGSPTVRDHGPGIAPDDLPPVFDRFYRALSARAVPGSGLGLAVARAVAHGHGGTLSAEAASGGGPVPADPPRAPRGCCCYPSRTRPLTAWRRDAADLFPVSVTGAAETRDKSAEASECCGGR